ncbi:hypothetical protein JCM33374_g3421 [Metschnikowia sp. JCM 33374]|nr:hypothetical protein JCM33374_g3421 [Metschnikowia sp. JCM 33374]
MRANFSFIAGIFLAVATSSLIGREGGRITKLLPKASLGNFAKIPKGKSLPEVFENKFDSGEVVEVILLGENHSAQQVIKGFLESGQTNGVQAIFIVHEEKVKANIEKLIFNNNKNGAMKDVMVVKYNRAKEIIQKLLENDDNLEEVKALLVVKDNRAKDIIHNLLVKDNMRNEIKVVLVGKDDKATKIIEQFLSEAKTSEEDVISSGKPHEAKNFENKDTEQTPHGQFDLKEDIKVVPPSPNLSANDEIKIYFSNNQNTNGKDGVELPGNRNLIPSIKAVSPQNGIIGQETKSGIPNQDDTKATKVELYGKEDNAEELIQWLLERDQKLKQVIKFLSGQDGRVKGLVEQLLGQDEKVKEIIEVIREKENRQKPVNIGFFTKTDKAKDLNELLFSKQDSGKEVNEGLLDQEVQDFKCALRAYKIDTQKTLDLLEKVFQAIEGLVRDLGPCNAKLPDQLAFVQHVFQSMADSIEVLRYYATAAFPGHNLIQNVVDLNIRFLALRDVNGQPDASIEGYGNKLKLSFQYLNYWASAFKEYDQIPFGRFMVFHRQYYQAESTLITLARHVMKKEDYFF